MSDTDTTTAPRPRLKREDRPDIVLPGGKVLRTRVNIAKDKNVCEVTIRRMNPATTYWGGVAYCDPNQIGEMIAASLKRRNAPPKRRRRA